MNPLSSVALRAIEFLDVKTVRVLIGIFDYS